jgi:hypothetical protein
MFNPIRAIRDAGAWTADKLGTMAEKTPLIKSMTPKQKAFAGGVAGTVLGVGILFAGAEIAMGSLLIGGLLSMFGILASFGPQLLGIGAAASGGAVFGAGMVQGADKHCNFLTKMMDTGDRVADKVARVVTRPRAPAPTQGQEPVVPGKPFVINSTQPAEAFSAVATAQKQAASRFNVRKLVQKQLKPSP